MGFHEKNTEADEERTRKTRVRPSPAPTRGRRGAQGSVLTARSMVSGVSATGGAPSSASTACHSGSCSRSASSRGEPAPGGRGDYEPALAYSALACDCASARSAAMSAFSSVSTAWTTVSSASVDVLASRPAARRRAAGRRSASGERRHLLQRHVAPKVRDPRPVLLVACSRRRWQCARERRSAGRASPAAPAVSTTVSSSVELGDVVEVDPLDGGGLRRPRLPSG